MASAIFPSVFVLRRYDVNVVLMSFVILPMLDAIMSVVVPLWTNDVVSMDSFHQMEDFEVGQLWPRRCKASQVSSAIFIEDFIGKNDFLSLQKWHLHER